MYVWKDIQRIVCLCVLVAPFWVYLCTNWLKSLCSNIVDGSGIIWQRWSRLVVLFLLLWAFCSRIKKQLWRHNERNYDNCSPSCFEVAVVLSPNGWTWWTNCSSPHYQLSSPLSKNITFSHQDVAHAANIKFVAYGCLFKGSARTWTRTFRCKNPPWALSLFVFGFSTCRTQRGGGLIPSRTHSVWGSLDSSSEFLSGWSHGQKFPSCIWPRTERNRKQNRGKRLITLNDAPN